jgi:dihydroorotate dehydrogenase
MFYPLIRRLLFCLPPETAHRFALKSLQYSKAFGNPQPSSIQTKTIMGLNFPNPVGLAAGLDKNGEYLPGLASLGFGFIEVGTVTPRPQPGNPKPRLFRIPKAQALINRMGFNNQGVDALLTHISHAHYNGILGINIGKNFDTPLEEAIKDYLFCLRKVYIHASYIVINISSPNTPGLRQLQQDTELTTLLTSLKEEQLKLTIQHGKHVPLVIKIAPDLEEETIAKMAKTFLDHSIDGVIATNTTISRHGVQRLRHGEESGGLSGRPLLEQSLTVVRQLHTSLQGKIPIIGCGGIFSATDAQQMLTAGASLLQIYSGLIYKGPGLIKEILEG